MNAELIKLYQDIRGSYWFIPTLMAACTLGIASGAGFIDSVLTGGLIYQLPLVSSVHPDDLRAVLTAIAGSMITVAGVTFSMTVVSVSNASGQFGPRLIRNFMRDRGNQLTLGTFISTFVYCLAILATVESGMAGAAPDADMSLPRLSFLIALVMALCSVAVLIYFIHHVPESLNIGNITSEIGRDLLAGIGNLFPKGIGEERGRRPDSDVERLTSRAPAEICISANGYIQAIDGAKLMEIAQKSDLVLRIECRPGYFITGSKPCLHAWPADKVDDKVRAGLCRAFATGRARTATQDTLFLVDQLVEVIGRALSPGVCDPYTAVNCIDWLEAALLECAACPAPDPIRYDSEGRLRVIAAPVTFETVVAAIADRSLQYVSADRNAAVRMIRMYGEVAANTGNDACRDILDARARQLVAAAKEALPLVQHRDEVAEEYFRTRPLFSADASKVLRRAADGALELSDTGITS